MSYLKEFEKSVKIIKSITTKIIKALRKYSNTSIDKISKYTPIIYSSPFIYNL